MTTAPPGVAYELELRFGLSNSKFRAGVMPSMLDALERSFDCGTHWKRVEDWHVITSYMHSSSVPNDARVLRTEMDQRRDMPAGVPRATTIFKERDQVVDLRTCFKGAVDQTPAVDVRIAVSRETAVPDSQIPEAVEPKEVHIKHRKCYYYSSRRCDTTEETWAYMLTKRWTGADFETAHRQQLDPQLAVHEIEVECVSRTLMLSDPIPTLTFNALLIAHSILAVIDGRCAQPADYCFSPVADEMLWRRDRTGVLY